MRGRGLARRSVALRGKYSADKLILIGSQKLFSFWAIKFRGINTYDVNVLLNRKVCALFRYNEK